MKVVDEETGKTVILWPTEELNADLAAYRERECVHQNTALKRVTVSGGATQFRKQCSRCGRFVGTAVRHSDAPSHTPAKDETLEPRYRRGREVEFKSIQEGHLRRQKARSNSFWDKYNEHLGSEKWKVIRQKVLDRAHGLCEGCLDAEAMQVHHLTYAHLGAEFLFELIAVCEVCHVRLHLESSDGARYDEWYEGHPCDSCRWESEYKGKAWCALSEMPSSLALRPDGPCGTDHALREGLK